MNLEEPRVKFDATVNLGQVITAISMIFSVVAAYFVLKSDIRDHEGRIVRVENTIEQQQVTNKTTNDSLNKIEVGVAVIRDRLERNGVKP